jgi:hypothetical protein
MSGAELSFLLCAELLQCKISQYPLARTLVGCALDVMAKRESSTVPRVQTWLLFPYPVTL